MPATHTASSARTASRPVAPLALITACILLACTLLATGCESKSDNANRLDIQASVGNVAAEITARVEQPGRVQTLGNAQVNTRFRTGDPTLVKTGNYGPIRVTVIAVIPPADTIAVGAVTLQLGKDFEYSVNASRQLKGSFNMCFGCSGYLKFPFRGSERATTDSLWLYYSAGKPCKDCVY